jgi:hypothetical protein
LFAGGILMAAHAFLVALLALTPAGSPAQGERAERSGHELRTAVRDAMRQQATTQGAEQEQATRKLVALFQEISTNSKLSDPEKERQLAYVRARLRRTSGALAKGLAKRGDAQLAADPPLAAQPAVQALLAQQPGNPARQQAGAAAGPLNFPAAGAANAGQGGGQSFSAMTNQNAQELIDLIQDTIAPHTWDIRGGNGVIRYFAPAQVLVIRQSGDVHGQLGDALKNLRKVP